MLFNFGKCKCLHTGHGNKDAQYIMGETIVKASLRILYTSMEAISQEGY